MLGLTKPKHFIPIHGEFRMQVQHGRLAIETGVAPDNVFIIENGTPIEFFADGAPGVAVRSRRLRVRRRAVRRRRRRVVLRDRASLANDGMFMIVVTVDKQTGSIVGVPRSSRAASSTSTSATRSWTRPSNGSIASIDTPGDHISEIGLLKSRSRTG
jgi:mRNA degradation ribonuclease J1/J2